MAMIPGERLPNFVLADTAGEQRMAYALSLGDPLWLVLAAKPSEALLATVRAAGSPDRRPILVSAAPCSGAGDDFVGLVDPDGGLSRHLGYTGAPTLLSFDANLRLETVTVGEDAIGALLQRRSMDPRPNGADVEPVTTVQAPLLTVPRVLGEAECRALCERFEAGSHQASGSHAVTASGDIELRPDPSLKARRDIILDGQADRDWLGERVARTVLPELAHAFAATAAGFEWFKLVRYDAGAGWFRRHRDNTTPDTAKRRFAITINLNTGDYRGGNLVFPEYGPTPYAPPIGAALVFSCALAHEVTEVTQGQRYALLSFLLAR
jgi:predicted 2-oxoglutarate/Fe(II)-dependent dioxygenase YbiX